MFPLSSVLMPYMPLPLRIFESRYLVMLGRLLDDDDPQFGVVLIERGPEAGGGEQRFSSRAWRPGRMTCNSSPSGAAGSKSSGG